MSDQLYPIDYDPTDFPDDDDGLEGEEEEYFDCGWMREGGCSLAGSEECDFECPNRDSMIAELDRRAKRKA